MFNSKNSLILIVACEFLLKIKWEEISELNFLSKKNDDILHIIYQIKV